MARFDSHVPPAIPVQFLPGVILAAFRGWMSPIMQCQVAWPGRGWMLQPVHGPML